MRTNNRLVATIFLLMVIAFIVYVIAIYLSGGITLLGQ